MAANGPAASNATGSEMLSYGTGFAIDAEGTIVTARHVIAGAHTVHVRFPGHELATAQVVRSSEATDLAVLKIDQPTPEFVAINTQHAARLGLPVFTIGFPAVQLLGAEPKFTSGAISATSGLHDEAAFLQTTVAVQPGNSGGPLMSLDGEVLGVMISRAADLPFLKETGALPENINFATKAENLIAVLGAPPASRKPARTRDEAIDRAQHAVCLVLARP
jgi:S1-C subfamily serine protease